MNILIVKPSRDNGTRKGLLDAVDGYVGERLVVSRSTQPLLHACRALADEGVDPSTRVIMRPAVDDR
jgi:hypothetical protein